MYLANLEIENFRLFGSATDNSALKLDLDPGLNVLVGENDSGKSTIVDAIRLLTGTASNEWFRLTSNDFHFTKTGQADTLRISGVFRGFAQDELSALVEHLSVEFLEEVPLYYLRVTLTATRAIDASHIGRGREVVTSIRSGNEGSQSQLDSKTRNYLRAIYLKPLRDAVQELAARQGSRLSQILHAHPEIQLHSASDWTVDAEESAIPTTLLGIVRQADHRLKKSKVIEVTQSTLNDQYLKAFSLGKTTLRGLIGIRSDALRQVLERMELYLDHENPEVRGENRGLGINNLLFIATELLLLGATKEPFLPLVLIEEPEAHLHPQLQLLLAEYLESQAKTAADSPRTSIQVILTCHSPNLAMKVPLTALTVVQGGAAYRMTPSHTLLDPSDYEYLRRFLDVTKAALFFARGVMIVEGDAEQLVLPAIARILGKSLTKHGVAIVRVGHTGLFRFARIFRRQNGQEMKVRVACLQDRDIPPVEAKEYIRPGRRTDAEIVGDELTEYLASKFENDGGPVQTFVSSLWTLEYDLAEAGLYEYVRAAVQLARSRAPVPDLDLLTSLNSAKMHCKERLESGLSRRQIAAEIYQPLYDGSVSKAITAQYLARMLELHPPENMSELLPQYLVAAIEYVTEDGGEEKGMVDANT